MASSRVNLFPHKPNPTAPAETNPNPAVHAQKKIAPSTTIPAIAVLLVVAFAVAAQPSAAARAHGEAAAAPAPGEAVLHPLSLAIVPLIPCSTVPDIPIIRDILHLICYNPPPSPPPPACREFLAGMAAPCGAFLTTNASEPVPAPACCNAYVETINSDLLCLCHVTNGEIGKFLPAPVDMERVFAFPEFCHNNPPLNLKSFANYCEISNGWYTRAADRLSNSTGASTLGRKAARG
ncbi:hypothetical protein ACP4OV_018791 [Aristida adscensionis]